MATLPPILLFTDFGAEGPYMGQMECALHACSPDLCCIRLQADAPFADPESSSYLLAAQIPYLPHPAVVVAVVDPGVGSPRQALAVRSGGRWLLGPDNGLLSGVWRADPRAEIRQLDWRPERLSASFHGRDLFAPAAARLALGEPLYGDPLRPDTLVGDDWPADLARVIYLDHYGNALTGLRAAGVPPSAHLQVGGLRLTHAHTFSSVPAGEVFWYCNSCGLVEIAVNGGRADALPGICVGAEVELERT